MNTLEEKKGEDILLLDIREIADFADYFILCSGNSERTLESLSESVAEAVESQYKRKAIAQGSAASGWTVIDLGDIVVHLFTPDQRTYYQLEQLWSKGKVLLHLQ